MRLFHAAYLQRLATNLTMKGYATKARKLATTWKGAELILNKQLVEGELTGGVGSHMKILTSIR